MKEQQRILTEKQTEILQLLQTNFALSNAELERILFLNQTDEPWIPADIQEAIARQVGKFRHISVTHDKYIAGREQVLYTATVIDEGERSFTRSGSAIVGESPNGIEMDVDNLAASRALNAALNAAGFNPFRAGSVVNIAEARRAVNHNRLHTDREKELHKLADEAVLRGKDLRQIHALATEKNLIQIVNGEKNMDEYRRQLKIHFGTETAAILSAAERAAVINWLNNYSAFLENIPEELWEDAMVA